MENSIYTAENEEIYVPEKMNIFKRLVNLFCSPGKLFIYLKRKPSILFPLFLICIGAIAIQLILREYVKDSQIDLYYNLYKEMGMNYSPEQLESLAGILMILNIALAPLSYLPGWAVVTLILYVVFRMFNCEKGMKKYFSMTAYITILKVVGDIIQALFIYFISGEMLNAKVTSIASLINPESAGIVLYSMAESLEVFNIWAYILYGIGFAFTGGVQKKKAYALTAVIFIISLLIKIGWTFLQNQVSTSAILGG